MNQPPEPGDFRIGVDQADAADKRFRKLRFARVSAQAALIIGDVLLLLLAFYIATEIRRSWSGGGQSWITHGLQIIPFYTVVGIYNGNYSQFQLNRPFSASKKVIATIMIATGLQLFMNFGVKNTSEFSRAIFLMATIFATAFLIILRLQVIAALRIWYGHSLENVLIVDDGGPDVSLGGLRPIVIRGQDIRENPNDPATLNRFGKVAREMDRVVVSCRRSDWGQWETLLKSLNVRCEIVSDDLHELGALGLHREDGYTSLIVSTGPLGLRDRAAKRALDLIVTIPAIILISPLLLVIALAIKLEDGGPILFVQERTGRANCHFRMLKFRSMRVDESDQAGDRSASRDDERITRVGRIIRRTSLDELPQLLNVIRGDMSLVGPRPHALGSTAGGKLFWRIDPKYRHRHSLKPGLTGLAQVRGYRGATSEEQHLIDRLGADLEYLNEWSPWRDLKIMMRTLSVLMHNRAF